VVRKRRDLESKKKMLKRLGKIGEEKLKRIETGSLQDEVVL